MKTVLACTSDVTNMYKDDEGLGAAWAAWDNSLKIDESLSTEGGNNTYSYTSAYPADTTAAYKEACEKGEGNTWTPAPDQSFQCRKEGEDKSGLLLMWLFQIMECVFLVIRKTAILLWLIIISP